jgi:hypothetical protein
MDKQLDLLQGTLDMLILKAVSLSPLHGYGILLRIQQISKERLEIQQGSAHNDRLLCWIPRGCTPRTLAMTTCANIIECSFFLRLQPISPHFHNFSASLSLVSIPNYPSSP